ncbi:uncharacterized protein LOC123290935 [Chrysoperla carnea]|uniref:uncharacterized protein LOC123290935 n=1 Tax=Chrysoperla carnea TaxID=189513 RepID=UPI001D0876C9|nr:uncharacterized protein LOC123290935 [Chrysoperla carnea]
MEKSNYIELIDVKLTKINKTHFGFSGTCIIKHNNFTRKNLLVSIHADQKYGNGYHPTSLCQLEKMNLCNLFDNDVMLFPALKAHIKPELTVCPIPAGTYKMTNYIPDPNAYPPFVPGYPGRDNWRIAFTFYDGDTIITGIYAFVQFTYKTDIRDILS